ncbi:MAG: hypothetical protein MUC38_07175 [Cyclobacteriaceae bacterium]|nr:hypothetical protein [Cyclobacteriaceae bacterium]
MKPMAIKAGALFLLLTLVQATCVEDEASTAFSNGTYTGTFIRSSPYADFAPASVTLTFSGHNFEGGSNTPRYPAICRGTIQATSTTATFTNECFWTADFDWSLILSGEYALSRQGEEIILTKAWATASYDQYRLTLQPLD